MLAVLVLVAKAAVKEAEAFVDLQSPFQDHFSG